jgi:hypothetical protein
MHLTSWRRWINGNEKEHFRCFTYRATWTTGCRSRCAAVGGRGEGEGQEVQEVQETVKLAFLYATEVASLACHVLRGATDGTPWWQQTTLNKRHSALQFSARCFIARASGCDMHPQNLSIRDFLAFCRVRMFVLTTQQQQLLLNVKRVTSRCFLFFFCNAVGLLYKRAQLSILYRGRLDVLRTCVDFEIGEGRPTNSQANVSRCADNGALISNPISVPLYGRS